MVAQVHNGMRCNSRITELQRKVRWGFKVDWCSARGKESVSEAPPQFERLSENSDWLRADVVSDLPATNSPCTLSYSLLADYFNSQLGALRCDKVCKSNGYLTGMPRQTRRSSRGIPVFGLPHHLAKDQKIIKYFKHHPISCITFTLFLKLNILSYNP